LKGKRGGAKRHRKNATGRALGRRTAPRVNCGNQGTAGWRSKRRELRVKKQRVYRSSEEKEMVHKSQKLRALHGQTSAQKRKPKGEFGLKPLKGGKVSDSIENGGGERTSMYTTTRTKLRHRGLSNK